MTITTREPRTGENVEYGLESATQGSQPATNSSSEPIPEPRGSG